MKKILLFILISAMIFSCGVNGQENLLKEQNKTYFYLLEKGGYNVETIDNRYISEKELKEIVNILFKREDSYHIENYENVTGGKLFEIINEKLGLPTEIIENRDKLSNQVLTFPTFFDIMDYYFSEILALNNLTREMGTMAENNGGYFLTYGQGKTKCYDSLPSGKVIVEMCEIELVADNDEIIELIFPLKDIDISMLYNKKEVCGSLFLMYDKSIVISANGELKRYITTDSFEILMRTNKDVADIEIVLFTGVYKKNTNLTTIAVERMN